MGGAEALLLRHVRRLKTRSDLAFLAGALRADESFKRLQKEEIDRLVVSTSF